MSEDDLNDIERHMLDCMNRTQSDARLSGFSDIVHEDVPRLIAEVRRLQAIEARFRDMLAMIYSMAASGESADIEAMCAEYADE